MRQAMTMSYNDAFLVMLIVNLVTLPAVIAAAPAQSRRSRRSCNGVICTKPQNWEGGRARVGEQAAVPARSRVEINGTTKR